MVQQIGFLRNQGKRVRGKLLPSKSNVKMNATVSGSAAMLSRQNENNPNIVKSMETPLILRFFLSLSVNWVG